MQITAANDVKDTVSFEGATLRSANMVLSQDQKYIYYGVASKDVIYQHDFTTHGVVGSFAVGDDPNLFVRPGCSSGHYSQLGDNGRGEFHQQ